MFIFSLHLPLIFAVEVLLQIFTKAIFPFSTFVDGFVDNNCRHLDFVHIFVVVYPVLTVVAPGKWNFSETFKYLPVFGVYDLLLFVEVADRV